jgi:hypothetical protein
VLLRSLLRPVFQVILSSDKYRNNAAMSQRRRSTAYTTLMHFSMLLLWIDPQQRQSTGGEGVCGGERSIHTGSVVFRITSASEEHRQGGQKPRIHGVAWCSLTGPIMNSPRLASCSSFAAAPGDGSRAYRKILGDTAEGP